MAARARRSRASSTRSSQCAGWRSAARARADLQPALEELMSVYEQKTESGPLISPDDSQAALAAAQQENAELRDKYLRAAAAIENTRKQAERETHQRMYQRLRSFCARLLEVAD